MGIKAFINNIFKRKIEGDTFYSELETELFYKEFAIQSCISIIANALVLSEFQTIEKGKEVKKNNYYLFNVEPNLNQNSTEFWIEVISKLVYKNECLIVQEKDQLFIADTFSVKKFAFFDDLYSGITIRDLQLNKTYKESEVFFLKLNDENIKGIIDGLYKDYSKLLASSIDAYKKANGRKGILKVKTMLPQTKDGQDPMEDLMNNKFKKYFNSDNAVLPLSDGLEFEESKAQSNIKDSRDIRAVVNDIIDFVAAAFHVPSGIIRGDLAGIEQQTDNFLMFCINPIAKLITSEVNRKMYGKEDYLNKTYVKVDTQKIRNVDLEKLSKSADLLFRIGVNSINDNLNMIGKEKLEEDWANEHYVTKNYQSVLSVNENLKGGEKNGTKNSQSGNKII